MPRAVADRIRELAPGKGDMVKRVTSIPMLYDIEARVRMMDQWPGYQQVLTLSSPPIETIAGPGDTPDVARVANDELKKICEARPDKFPAWVASLPLNNVEASLEEIDRVVAGGARGIQIFTNVNGRPLDDREFLPIFVHATSHHKVPIWMHPARDARVADYPGEAKSKYEIWQVLGWPYETSVASDCWSCDGTGRNRGSRDELPGCSNWSIGGAAHRTLPDRDQSGCAGRDGRHQQLYRDLCHE
jgi:uncharacterized protein